MPHKITTPFDYAVIVIIALLALIAAVPILAAGRTPALTASITHDSGTTEINLTQSQIFEIKSGGHTLEITVADGKIAVTHADCPDLLCVNQGEINRRGQIIVCIPAKVLIEIKGGETYADEIAG